MAQNGGTPAHDSGGAQLGGFIQNPRSCESQRANSKAVREDPPRRASGRGLNLVNAIFSLNYTLKPAKRGAGELFKERSCCPLLVKFLSSKLQGAPTSLCQPRSEWAGAFPGAPPPWAPLVAPAPAPVGSPPHRAPQMPGLSRHGAPPPSPTPRVNITEHPPQPPLR